MRRYFHLGKYSGTILWKNISYIVLVIFFMVSVINVADARRNFFIERPRLGLALSFEYDQDSRDGPFINRKDTSTTYSEELIISTKGWVYHPALLAYRLEFSPEWEQFREHASRGATETSDTFLSGYEAELEFLQFKPYTLTLFGNRELSSIRSNFAEKSNVENDILSAQLNFKYSFLPSSLTYTYRERNQTGFFDLDEEEDRVDLIMQHYGTFSNTTFKSTYKDISTTTFNTVIDSNAWTNSLYNILSKSNISLISNLNYDEIDCSFVNRKNYSITESLTFIHRRNLKTSYDLRYEKYNQFDKVFNEDADTETRGVGFNLNHLLYENLTTNINMSTTESRSRVGRDAFHKAGVKWNYNRAIPPGMLNMNVGYDYSILDRSTRIDTNTTTLVLDEAIALTDGTITFLGNEDIVVQTVIVTELDSFNNFGIEYIAGVDYELVVVDQLVRIIRKPGGGIANGQTVFVRYRYVSFPAFDYSLLNQNYGINLDVWSSWNLYYTLHLSKQKLLRGTPPDNFEFIDDSIHAAGIEYRWRWSTTSLEWEDRFTKSAPTETWRAIETVTFRPGINTFVTLTGSYEETTFKNEGVTEDFIGLSSDINWRLSNWSNLTVRSFLRDTTGGTQDFTNTGISTLYEWRYRVWQLNLEYTFTNERNKEVDQTFKRHYVLVELIRELF